MIETIRNTALEAMDQQEPAVDQYAFSDRIHCFRETGTSELRETIYEPALCLILQGEKQTLMDGRTLRLAEGDAVLISHHVPVQAQVTQATKDAPYIALIVKIDMAIIREFFFEIRSLPVQPAADHAVASAKASEAFLDTVTRLLAALNDPLETKLIGDSIYRELHLRMLQASHGGMLRQMAASDSMANGIARAIKLLRENFTESVPVGIVASEAGMSESSLYQRFKDITGTTPNQYLKSIRLQEAQTRLSLKGLTVAEAAYEVGYKSVNHFSRDYAKHFGAPPRTARVATA